MNREEFDRLYLDRAVHCDTEEKANEFLALADSVGYRWLTKRKLINCSRWEKYKEKTCYEVTKKGFAYADTNYFNPLSPSSRQIIEYQLQPKFKVGDKVRVKDTLFITINGKVGVIERVGSGVHVVKVDDKLWLLSENNLEEVLILL